MLGVVRTLLALLIAVTAIVVLALLPMWGRVALIGFGVAAGLAAPAIQKARAQQ